MRSLALPQGAVPLWHQRLQKTWEKKCRVSQVTLSLCKALAVNHRIWKKLRPLCIQLYLPTFVHFDLTFRRRSESDVERHLEDLPVYEDGRLQWQEKKKKTVSGHSADICLSAWFFKFSGIGMNLNWDAGDRNFLQEEAAHVSVEIWIQEEMLGLQEQGGIPAPQPVGLWCHPACRTSWIHPCFFETEGTFLENQ